jgi:hypothetical protein
MKAFPVLVLALLATAQEEPASTASRPAGEIKAMLGLLAAPRGAVPQEIYLSRLRQHRYLAGVPFEHVAYNASQGELAHAAADICSRLDKLTHSPERPAGMSDADYKLGKDGAGQCNLFGGLTEPAACVDGWMNDSDPSNIDRVGHRRWCLNPMMGTSAFGSVGNYAAMYAFDGSFKDVPAWDIVAWPARGAMPSSFFEPRQAWSISPNPARYTIPAQASLKVSIHAADGKQQPTGAPLKLDYFRLDTGGFGSGPAVIFRPEKIVLEGTYLVTLEGLKAKGGEAAPLRYSVTFISLQRIPDGLEGATAATRWFQGRLERIAALGDAVDRMEQYGAMLAHEGLRQADPKLRGAAQKALAELLKDPAVKREHDSAQKLGALAAMEQKAGKSRNQLTTVALGYRDLAQAYKETRAGGRAAKDFERLKAQIQ